MELFSIFGDLFVSIFGLLALGVWTVIKILAIPVGIYAIYYILKLIIKGVIKKNKE